MQEDGGPIHRPRSRYRLNPMDRPVFIEQGHNEKLQPPDTSWKQSGTVSMQNSLHVGVPSRLSIVTEMPEETVDSDQSNTVNQVLRDNFDTDNPDELVTRIADYLFDSCPEDSQIYLKWIAYLAQTQRLNEVRNRQLVDDLFDVVFQKLRDSVRSDEENNIISILETIDTVLYLKMDCTRDIAVSWLLRCENIEIFVRIFEPHTTYTKCVVKILCIALSCPVWKRRFAFIPNIMSTLFKIMNSEHQTICAYAVLCVQKLLFGDNNLPIELSYIDVFLKMLEESVVESVLFEVSNILKEILKDYAHFIHHFVSKHGVDICANLLSHGSPRVQHNVARCIVYTSFNLSSSFSISFPTVDMIVQSIGSMDYHLNVYAITSLANLCDNNNIVKDYLVRKKNIVDTLMRILLSFENPEFFKIARLLEHDSLMETTFWLMQQLLDNPPMNDSAAQVCNEIVQTPGWIYRFTSVLARANSGVISRLLMVLNNIFEMCPQAIDMVQELESNVDTTQGLTHFVFRRLAEATELIVAPSLAIWASCCMFSTPFSLPALKDPKYIFQINEIYHRASSLLVYIAEHSEAELVKIANLLKTDLSPLSLIGFFIRSEAFNHLKVMFKLCTRFAQLKGELARMWHRDILLRMQVYSCCRKPEIEAHAKEFFELIG